MAQWVKNLSSIHEDVCLIPGLTQWIKDLVLSWLWCRLAAAAPIGPLAWKLRYVASTALKSRRKKKKERKKKGKKRNKDWERCAGRMQVGGMAGGPRRKLGLYILPASSLVGPISVRNGDRSSRRGAVVNESN